LKSQEEAIRKAKKGDREAFSWLIKTYENKLYHISHSILPSDSDCLDATQEAVIKAWLRMNDLKEDRFFKTWLIRILINECRRILKRRGKVIPINELTISDEVSPSFEHALDLKDAINQLEPSLRIVIFLHYYEDLPVREIAQILEIPEGTVKSRLIRSRQTLAAMISPDSRRVSKK
jgi:RNA polymerase sigma factor (sigma-70 family)